MTSSWAVRGAAVALGLLGSVAIANVISGTIGSAQFSVNCPSGCTLIGATNTGTYPNPQPTIITPPVNVATPADHVANINTLAGTSFTASQATVVNVPDPGDTNFNGALSAAYFWLKIDGPNAGTLYLRNDGGAQTINYSATGGTANGLSQFGQVPLPAGVVLFLSALAGLFGFRRWQARTAASAA